MFKGITLTDFILEEQRKQKKARGNFTLLLHQIENAARIIASHVKATGLVDIIGATGEINSFGEEVQKLDEFANNLLTKMLLASGQVYAVVSEEMSEAVFAPEDQAGEYIVYFDPLDGSSNIDTNCPIGTIFSIYHKNRGILQKGEDQVAAGYVMYGSSVMFVYTSGNGVNGFTLDPAIGVFLHSHPDIKIPEKGKIYSINEAYGKYYDKGLNKYLKYLKDETDSSSRYVGSLVADAHRTFVKGGAYFYPASSKQPEGKLRLMIEVNPFAFLTVQAGGKVLGIGKESPLTIVPKNIHQRSPFIMGSKENIEEYLSFQ